VTVARFDRARSAGFEPCGAVTGIGSLPIAGSGEAIDFVGTWCPRLPFCPQPPSSDLVAVTLTQLDPSSDAAIRFELFSGTALDGGFPEAMALKTQLTGPVTLAHLLEVAGVVRAVDAVLVARMADQVAQIAARQVRRLLPTGLPVLLYVDEPALALADCAESSAATTAIVHVLRAIQAAGGISGVHCCSMACPGPLVACGARVVSFDATAETIGAPPTDTFSDRTHLLSFGLVPTTTPLPTSGAAFSRWLVRASETGNPRELARRTIVTATCGLGAVDIAFARSCFEVATGTGALIGRVAHARLPSSAA
jgi:hypothetical protein